MFAICFQYLILEIIFSPENVTVSVVQLLYGVLTMYRLWCIIQYQNWSLSNKMTMTSPESLSRERKAVLNGYPDSDVKSCH